MIVIDGVDIPANCHECGVFGISDLVGIKCPVLDDKDLYCFDGRPDGCPIRTLPTKDVRMLLEDELNDLRVVREAVNAGRNNDGLQLSHNVCEELFVKINEMIERIWEYGRRI